MFKFFTGLSLIFIVSLHAYTSQGEAEVKKTHLEDIFIWKISDELKLTAQEEKKFTEISKSLNKKKSELNKKIHEVIENLNETSSEPELKKYRKLIQDYNQVSISEFDSIKQLLGVRKFVSYLKIKNELTNKVKSILIADKSADVKKETVNKPLPPPKIIIEKAE